MKGGTLVQQDLILYLTQSVSLFVLLAYLAGRTGMLARFFAHSLRWPHRGVLALATGLLGIVGTYWGVPVQGAIANTRVMGPMLGGLYGGPLVGLAAGLIAGIHRYSLGGFTDFACAVSTVTEGLLAGLVHLYVSRRGGRMTALTAGLTTAAAELLQMVIILLVAQPWDDALHLVEAIALPMTMTNAVGVGLMVAIVQDARQQQDRIAALQAQTVLEIASKTLPHLRVGLTPESTLAACRIILERTGMGSVTITNQEQILAFVGVGQDHHKAGVTPRIQTTYEVLSDGSHRVMQSAAEVGCSVPGCPLSSGVCVPLLDRDQVVGTLSLYQKGRAPVRQVTVETAVGLGHLLSTQIELARIQAMSQLVTQAELRALHAQINPHFLFNALGTISALCRRQPEKARELLIHLSHYLRSSIRAGNEMVTLGEELEFVEAYMAIEKARFAERLRYEVTLDAGLIALPVPILCLQLLVENSVRHGIMPRASGGTITVAGRREGDHLVLTVSDDGVGMDPGAPSEHKGHGVGLSNVRQRFRYLYNAGDLVEVTSSPGVGTSVTLRLPLNTHPAQSKEVFERELLRTGRG